MPKTKATFIEDWSYEIKLDGYRALAIKSGGKMQLRSRNDNDFTERYSSIAAALRTEPDERVLDGEEPNAGFTVSFFRFDLARVDQRGRNGE